VWNHHFAAVAGDAIGFEAFPPTEGLKNFGKLVDFSIIAKEKTADVLPQFYTSIFFAFLDYPLGSCSISRSCRKNALG
jgi:hypothetical protein